MTTSSNKKHDSSSSQPVTFHNPEIKHDEVKKPGTIVTLPFGFGPIPSSFQNKRIFYFDIDNCLYKRSTQIHDLMQVKIHKYFKDNLQLDDEEAHKLHMNYYKTYGLAIEGLVRNHQVDALDYNSKVDDSLDLNNILSYNQDLRDMLIELKKSDKYDYFWLITNAYKNHALRVVSFLGLGDLFDGLTYCDYSKFPIICKPMKEFFENCLTLTNIDYTNPKNVKLQTFIDDSEINVRAAYKIGFGTVIHFIEVESEYQTLIAKPDYKEFYSQSKDDGKIKIIRDILELPNVI
ncbi:Haloacid dehalogenase-like hydrolase-domain-containing protein [Scheffersomyces coipomensis]|uniref:Haloacid dehalogenase-like hydrolase-domain-containing protein n=1 Tax=Scheffersomyces coipomensis TaxID=1788519 RepID=UPI00315CA386